MSSYEELKSHIKQYNKVIVAFSGGIDSYFVLKASIDSLDKENVLAVTGDSPSLKRSERELTIKLAGAVGANHRIIFTEELNNRNYYNNPDNRCFFCKNELYDRLSAMKNDLEYNYVLDGTNYDDMNDYRPGIKASEIHGIKSPLSELKFTKQEIRNISHELGLEIWNKPASPCLSSRIPHGQKVTQEKLAMVENAEEVLKKFGFKEFRVRHYEISNNDSTNNTVTRFARIEISALEMEKMFNTDLFIMIDENLQYLGYDFVTLDMGGLRSGSLNRQNLLPVLNQN